MDTHAIVDDARGLTAEREAPEGAPGPEVDDTAERLFVGLVWLAATLALVYFVVSYGRNVPYYEDYELVPVLSGRRPFSFSWLLEWTVVEHRTVLAKLLLYPIWLVSGGDFRSSMWVDAAALSGLAYACLRTARAARGRAAFSDALFPILLLEWGHAENQLFFIQLFFVAATALFTAIVLMISTGRWEGSLRGTAVLGACLALMPLNGGVGMTLAPPLVAWAAYAAWRRWRSGDPTGRRQAAILAGSCATTVLLAAFYVVGYGTAHRMAGTGPRTLRTVARTSVETLSLALGPAGRDLWPWFGLAVALLFGLTACALAFLVEARRAERLRISGLFACLAAVGLMVAAIGYGRAPIGTGAGFPSRYALLVAPAVVCVYLAAAIYGGHRAGRFVQVLLFAGACALIGPNLQLGLEYGRFRAGPADALASDVRTGIPPQVLGQRYSPKLGDGADFLGERLAMLRDAGLGPYKGVEETADDLSTHVREVPLPIAFAGSNQVAVEGNVIRGLGPDPYVVLALPEPTYVVGIRLRFSITNGDAGPAAMQVYWRRSGRNDFDESQRNSSIKVLTGPSEQTQTVWIYDEIDGFRIDPDHRPCEMTLSEVVLLVRE